MYSRNLESNSSRTPYETLYERLSWSQPLFHDRLDKGTVWESALGQVTLWPLGQVTDLSQSKSDG